MKRWTEAMLLHERPWEPKDILEKLDTYMEFLSVLTDQLLLKK